MHDVRFYADVSEFSLKTIRNLQKPPGTDPAGAESAGRIRPRGPLVSHFIVNLRDLLEDLCICVIL